MTPRILVTGFPGFLARRLVPRLLERDPGATVVALVEERMAAQAKELAPDRVEVLVGDIAAPRLGLAQAAWDELAAGVTDVFHLAAIYSLAVPLEIAQRVNVDGTGNVIELCRAAPNLRRHNYISTAYVAGLRNGVVYEHELVLGQGFKNHYESTKFQAEVWVRESLADVPTTILRPAIVVGDSRSGETQKFDGPYYMLRLISLALRLHVPVPQIGSAESAFNVVPVDFVVAAIAAAAADPDAAGKTLHLVDPSPVSAAELMVLLAQAYAGKSARLRFAPGLVDTMLRSKTMRRLFADTPRESVRYLNHPVRFDTRVAEEVLGRSGVVCPPLPDYVDAITAFFREHEDDEAYSPPPAG